MSINDDGYIQFNITQIGNMKFIQFRLINFQLNKMN